MRKVSTVAAVIIVMSLISVAARGSDLSKDIVTVKPLAGVFFPDGAGLDTVTPMGGIRVDWEIDDTFGLRLGWEYAEADISGGSAMKLSRFPLMVTTPLSKRPWPFRNFYLGYGCVTAIANYSDGSYPEVNGTGLAIMVGRKMSKHFNAEVSYDTMKKLGRNYGGYSLIVTYGGY